MYEYTSGGSRKREGLKGKISHPLIAKGRKDKNLKKQHLEGERFLGPDFPMAGGADRKKKLHETCLTNESVNPKRLRIDRLCSGLLRSTLVTSGGEGEKRTL